MFEVTLEVRNLKKTFGDAVAVRDVSFEVGRGEILGLLGANGAGKTTTIHMLLGITKPTSGFVKVFGKDLEKCRVEVLERVNFASSYIALPYNLKVWQNLYVFAEIYGVRKAREKIDELLHLFEIHHLRNKSAGTLSSGETTRLNLCKALLNEPELLLLDEPTASLDPDLADKVRRVLRTVQKEKGMTVVATSHNMLDVSELCDRIVFMHSGTIAAEGSADEIMESFGSKSLEDVFITIARTESLKRVTV